MLLRKNTKPFKTLHHIVKSCERRPDRDKLIRLYITRAGQSIQERISVDAIQGDASVFYNMGFETVLSNLESSIHQLHASDDVPGIYFFRSNLSKSWDECPFEFDEAIQKEFKSLPDLPATRKKEKSEKFVLPAPNLKSESPKENKPKDPPKKDVKREVKQSRQPNFKLKHKLNFTDLDTVVFKETKLRKEDVLNYYDKISEYILPHVKDRHLSYRMHDEAFRQSTLLTTALFTEGDHEEIPEWIKTSRELRGDERMIIVNDKEHLLACVELGSVEFVPHPANVKKSDSPDYAMIAIDSPEYDIAKAVEGTRVARSVLTGLKLPSFVKTDGRSGLHIYIPLDSKSDFETSKAVAEYICRLIHLKVPDLVALEGAEDYTYGKVTLSFSMNEANGGVVAPYSLISGETGTIATPLYWEELDDALNVDAFNPGTIFSRLKNAGDPFERMNKKINADDLLSQLNDHYGFLF